MSLSQQDFVDAHKANIDSILSLASAAFEGSEQLLALNLNTARALLEDSLSHGKSLSGVKDLQDAFSINIAFGQPLVEKAIAYSRGIYEISSRTNEQFLKFGEARQSDFNKSLSGFLDRLGKAAPAGSDVAIAAFKSAISAANSALDNANRAVKQVTDITEASVAAATNATVKAVSATTSASSAVARKKAA